MPIGGAQPAGMPRDPGVGVPRGPGVDQGSRCDELKQQIDAAAKQEQAAVETLQKALTAWSDAAAAWNQTAQELEQAYKQIEKDTRLAFEQLGRLLDAEERLRNNLGSAEAWDVVDREGAGWKTENDTWNDRAAKIQKLHQKLEQETQAAVRAGAAYVVAERQLRQHRERLDRLGQEYRQRCTGS